jgi:hypothetical protein
MYRQPVRLLAALTFGLLLLAPWTGCSKEAKRPGATSPGSGAEVEEPHGYVISSTLEPRGGEKRTVRTYLLGRHAVGFDANSKLDAVYDLQAGSWVDAGGKRTTLADAESQFDARRVQTEANLKAAPDTPYVRALKQALRPTFNVERAGDRLVMKSPAMTLEVVPAVTPLPRTTAEQVFLLDRMIAYRNGREEVKGQPPYMMLALNEECRKLSMYPSVIDMTIRAGGEPSVAQATITFSPLTAEQHTHMAGLVQRVEALADSRD